MRYPSRHHHSLHCILPPHLLRAIAQNGSSEQRVRALRTFSVDSTLRAMRLANSGVSPAPIRRRPLAMLGGVARMQRTIYDMKQGEVFPGVVVRSEGQEEDVGDPAVDEAYTGLGATYDFFWKNFGRNSIDADGMPLNAHVHYGSDYNNAFWDGQRMVFGDGDGDLFNRFTIALDIIGHELSHGVTEDEGPLWYFQQSGALNESLSDVFGSLVKQQLLNQTADKADWLIGAGLFTENVEGQALRSMKAPGTAYDDDVLGKDPQPRHMNGYVTTWQDNGGVHINSGIPNRAFCLAATSLGGYAWERAGLIWYETLLDARLRPDIDFQLFARLTVMAAARLYGRNSEEEKAVRDAWNQVGLRVYREKVVEPARVRGISLEEAEAGHAPTH